MISIKASDKSGFHINHSFPKVPVDLVGNPNGLIDPKGRSKHEITLLISSHQVRNTPYVFRWMQGNYVYKTVSCCLIQVVD